MSTPAARRLIIAISGATGAVSGVRLLQVLQETADVETHLVVSGAGVPSLHQELDMNRKEVESFADVEHDVRDIGAAIASGSFQSDGMVPRWSALPHENTRSGRPWHVR